jgi:hypothetical protein
MNYAGFDTYSCPDFGMMQWLKDNTNLSFCGFYLGGAPCHGDAGWMGTRAVLAAQGWGMAAIYVGQQEPGNNCGANILTSDQGNIDGQQATSLMSAANAGFPIGSVVYLDIEGGGPASAQTKAYYQAWVDAVFAGGLYRPGVYCSYTTAPSLLAVRSAVQVWATRLLNVPDGGYTNPFGTDDPVNSGVNAATVWQYAQNQDVDFAGAPADTLHIDLNFASVSDPSAPPA